MGFDASEFSAVVDSLNESSVLQQAEEASYMSDVDSRLAVAGCYRTLLTGNLFSDSDAASQIVESEIRAFVKERLEVLLSIRAEKKASLDSAFTPQQIESLRSLSAITTDELVALKALAAKVLKKPVLIQDIPASPVTPKRQPTLNQKALPVSTPPEVTPPTEPQSAESKAQPKRPGRPKKISPVPEVFKTTTEINEKGEEFHRTVQRIQRPQGQVPFPSEPAALQAATEVGTQQQLNLPMSAGSGVVASGPILGVLVAESLQK